MVFACQRDSFLTEFSTRVVSCSPAKFDKIVDGKNCTISGYEVILDDTILFPEGGGQPCDYGYLNDAPVYQVLRRGTNAVHFTESCFKVDEPVRQRVDWERRLDHMQQHSGQHLITAYVESLYGYKTTAWWLGKEISFIELDALKIESEEIENLERIVNEKIREGLNVSVQEYKSDDPALKEIHTRGLPDDHTAEIRVVTIEQVESNICCGTHVSNLSQLQAIKLVGVQKGKKGKVNLQFLVGNRVLRRLSSALQKEQALTTLLNNGPELHIELVEKLQKAGKVAQKNLHTALKELAGLEVKLLKGTSPRPKFYALHRKDADNDFIETFIRETGDTETLLMLSVGDEKGAGQVVLYGRSEYVEKFGPIVCSQLDGSGNCKGNKFQGKVKNLKNRKKVVAIIEKQINENEAEQ